MLLRFISNGPARTTLTLVQTGSTTGYTPLAQMDFGNADWQHQFSGQRGTQGALPTPGVPQNRTVTLPLRISGVSKDDLSAKMRALEGVVDELRRYGGLIAWQSNNQSFRQWFRVLTATVATTEWGSRAENINRDVAVVTALCAPYVEGDPLDLYDAFTTSAITDYTFDAGGVMTLGGGFLTAGDTNDNRFWHNLSGYQVTDCEATLGGYALGSTSSVVGVILRRTAANNYLIAQIDNAAARINIQRVTAGTTVSLATLAITALTVGSWYWLRFRAEGNVLIAEHWNAVPRPQATATNTLTYQLASGTEQTSHGRTVAGQAGFRIQAAGTPGLTFAQNVRVEPYTYRGRGMPTEFQLLAVPGSADALADAWLHTNPSAANAAQFGLIGWTRPYVDVYNWIWNGGFEYAASGWSAAAASGLTNAATSVTNTGQVLYGMASGRVVTPGVAAAEGANFHIYRRFERGKPYTFTVSARSNTGASQSVALKFGVSGDVVVTSAQTLPAAGTWTQISTVWYPTADRQEAYACLVTNATSAYTWDMDAAMVYEGTTAPTAVTQTQGRGAYPPFGRLAGAAAFSTAGGATITADATAYSGYRLQVSPGTGAFSLNPAWRIDPGLMAQDDYQQGSLEIEVWARLYLSGDHTGVGIQAFAAPLFDYSSGNSSPSAIGSYTREWGGTTSYLVPQLSAGVQAWTRCRLGTIVMPAGGATRQPWELQLNVSGTAGVASKIFAIDEFLLVPTRGRCLSPTGSDKVSGYPSLFPGSAAVVPTRVVRSDLSGLVGIWTTGAQTYDLAPASGLGGSPIEIPAGSATVVPLVTAAVPDTTTGTDTLADFQNWGFHVAIRPRWGRLRDA